MHFIVLNIDRNRGRWSDGVGSYGSVGKSDSSLRDNQTLPRSRHSASTMTAGDFTHDRSHEALGVSEQH
jgi:hypothetical protein